MKNPLKAKHDRKILQTDAFGLWKGRSENSLEHERQLRSGWCNRITKHETETIETDSLHLSEKDREASRLTPGQPSLTDIEIEQTWLVEAQRRARELDEGEVKPVSADAVRKKAGKLLNSNSH